MKKLMLKMSRRERLYLIAGGAILLFGVVVYPATKKAKAYRVEQTEMLEDEVALLEDFTGMLNDAEAIQRENEQLRDALRGADDLLFPPIENPIIPARIKAAAGRNSNLCTTGTAPTTRKVTGTLRT